MKINTPSIKPRLLRRDGKWKCHDNYYIWGTGNSMREAYVHWQSRCKTYSSIPRHGVWNRRSVREWYYTENCKAIRVYIGDKQIVGYDPDTDLLILRG